MNTIAVEIKNLSFSYPNRRALKEVNLRIYKGEIFGLLGPNGGGKTTLFRILTTYFSSIPGSIQIFGLDIEKNRAKVRNQIGVVFQHPSLDKKLTVEENLTYQGYLYGISGETLKSKIKNLLDHFNILDRATDQIELLSGGLQRRVEIAKSMLHSPPLIFMDEPSTGLDPGARKDLWDILKKLKSEGATILLTTHLMEEAERADRLAILNEGELVALGSPNALKEEIGGDVVVIESKDPVLLCRKIQEKFQVKSSVVENAVRIEKELGAELVPLLAQAFGNDITSMMVGKPTLEDVFIHRTGHRFWRSKDE